MGAHAVIATGMADPAMWAAAARQRPPDGVVDIVPAAASVLVTFATSAQRRDAEAALHSVVEARPDEVAADVVDIDVRYDGVDLTTVAVATGLSVDDVVTRHSSVVYSVAFCGFAPGFAYLRGLPVELHLPRRSTPRTRVPSGAVAVASEYTAVYPRPSPGGWHLLGTATIPLFDPDRTPPTPLAPGTPVRFHPL